ncbi:hypothetical protein SRHO_G00054420 [Serrasalmus rhombeus]
MGTLSIFTKKQQHQREDQHGVHPLYMMTDTRDLETERLAGRHVLLYVRGFGLYLQGDVFFGRVFNKQL